MSTKWTNTTQERTRSGRMSLTSKQNGAAPILVMSVPMVVLIKQQSAPKAHYVTSERPDALFTSGGTRCTNERIARATKGLGLVPSYL